MNKTNTCKICGALNSTAKDYCDGCCFDERANTITNLNYCQAADDIIEIFEQHGFTSDAEPDVELLRQLIVSAIQNRIESNG